MSVADAKKPIVIESPSLFRTWLTNKNLQYDFAVSTILKILYIAAVMYMKRHKISVTVATQETSDMCIFGYIFFGLASCVCWLCALGEAKAYDMYLLGRTCHIFGLGILLHLLYSISPSLALWFGIPSSLWFAAVFIVPLYTSCLAPCFEVCGDCWKLLNEHQVRVVYV